MQTNYKTIKLEKGMYKDKNKSFSEILEELDPSENYQGTPLANLDAFQRQLKRFNIRVNGYNSDAVSKFFSTSDAQVLFPEYIARSINLGIEEENSLKNIVANTIKINNLNYSNIYLNSFDDNQEIKEIKEGDPVPEVKIQLTQKSTKLKKIGNMLTCSYETLQYQKISAFNVALKQIGRNFNNILFKDAVKTIILGDGSNNTSPVLNLKQKLTYPNLIEIWTKLKPYNFSTLIVSPNAMQKLLLIPELLNPQTGFNFQNTGVLTNPLGAKILYSTALTDVTMLALDKTAVLNYVIAQYLNIESDKIIDKQLNQSVVTMRYAFTKLFTNASLYVKIEN